MSLSSRDIIAFSSISGVGPAAIHKLLSSGFAKSGDQSLLPPRVLEALDDNKRSAAAYSFADEQLERAYSAGIEVLTRVDPAYPSNLLSSADSPPVLFAKGNVASLSKSTVGVIGTREPTPHGGITTRRITAFFAQEDFAIVSGLAIGCDAIAHQECVRLKSTAIAVLAHGLHTVAPKRNAALAAAIVDVGGVLISEFALGVEPQPRLFVQRDKTQALLSRAIVMVQSDLEGGSLHASRAALRANRALIIPKPTPADIAANEPKSRANLLLSGSNIADKSALLKCEPQKTDLIFVVRHRDDYPEMLRFINNVFDSSPAIDTNKNQTLQFL